MLNKKQFIAAIVLVSFFLFPFSALAAGNCTGYAWGENIGWLNFNPADGGGVTVADAGVTGYVWAENVGWIKLDYDGVAGAVNDSATNWGVTNDGSGNLAGYAWGENIGWINFYPTPDSRVIITGGNFSGYAWAENVGWIQFDHGQTSEPATAWSPAAGNSAPTITSVSDYPDPLVVGNTITFSVNWNDADAEGIKMLICKTSNFTPGATPSCDNGQWCSNDNDYDLTKPIAGTYVTQEEDIGVNNYYAYVCDDEPTCSSASAGAFTVGTTSVPSIIIRGGLWLKGLFWIK